MEPKAEALQESFLEALALSLFIVVLTNVFSFFLVIGSKKQFEDSSPTPIFKEESLAIKKQVSSGASHGKQSLKGGLLPQPLLSIMRIQPVHRLRSGK